MQLERKTKTIKGRKRMWSHFCCELLLGVFDDKPKGIIMRQYCNGHVWWWRPTILSFIIACSRRKQKRDEAHVSRAAENEYKSQLLLVVSIFPFLYIYLSGMLFHIRVTKHKAQRSCREQWAAVLIKHRVNPTGGDVNCIDIRTVTVSQ